MISEPVQYRTHVPDISRHDIGAPGVPARGQPFKDNLSTVFLSHAYHADIFRLIKHHAIHSQARYPPELITHKYDD